MMKRRETPKKAAFAASSSSLHIDEVPEASRTFDEETDPSRKLFQLISSINPSDILEVPESSKTVHGSLFCEDYAFDIPQLVVPVSVESVEDSDYSGEIPLGNNDVNVVMNKGDHEDVVLTAASTETGELESRNDSSPETVTKNANAQLQRTSVQQRLDFFQQRNAVPPHLGSGPLRNAAVLQKGEASSAAWNDEPVSKNAKLSEKEKGDTYSRSSHRLLPPSNSRADVQEEFNSVAPNNPTFEFSRPVVPVACVMVGGDEGFLFVSHMKQDPISPRSREGISKNSVTTSVAAAVAASAANPKLFERKNLAKVVGRGISQLDGKEVLFADVTGNDEKEEAREKNFPFEGSPPVKLSARGHSSIYPDIPIPENVREDICFCSTRFCYIYRLICFINLLCLGVSIGLEVFMDRNDNYFGFIMIGISFLNYVVICFICSLSVGRVWVSLNVGISCVDFMLAIALYFYRLVTAIQAGAYIGYLLFFAVYAVVIRFPCCSVIIYYRAALSLREKASTSLVKKKIAFTQGMLSVLQDITL